VGYLTHYCSRDDLQLAAVQAVNYLTHFGFC
jgi:hypothetical protein